MKTKKLSISFSEHYNDVYQYLKTKHNISLFVCELVRNELNNKSNSNQELENRVEELVKKVLKENNYSYTNNLPTTTTENIINPLTENDKSLIKDLF